MCMPRFLRSAAVAGVLRDPRNEVAGEKKFVNGSSGLFERVYIGEALLRGFTAELRVRGSGTSDDVVVSAGIRPVERTKDCQCRFELPFHHLSFQMLQYIYPNEKKCNI